MLNFFCTKVEDFYTFDLYNFIFLPKEVDKKSVEIVILLKKTVFLFSINTFFVISNIFNVAQTKKSKQPTNLL